MQFWLLKTSNRYVRTQGEAIKSKEPWEMEEIPLDKDSVLAMLNKYKEDLEALALPAIIEAVESPVSPPVAVPTVDFSSGSVLSRMDNPGTDVDGIVEKIGKSKGYALRRYAGAVAVAFQALSN